MKFTLLLELWEPKEEVTKKVAINQTNWFQETFNCYDYNQGNYNTDFYYSLIDNLADKEKVLNNRTLEVEYKMIDRSTFEISIKELFNWKYDGKYLNYSNCGESPLIENFVFDPDFLLWTLERISAYKEVLNIKFSDKELKPYYEQLLIQYGKIIDNFQTVFTFSDFKKQVHINFSNLVVGSSELMQFQGKYLNNVTSYLSKYLFETYVKYQL